MFCGGRPNETWPRCNSVCFRIRGQVVKFPRDSHKISRKTAAPVSVASASRPMGAVHVGFVSSLIPRRRLHGTDRSLHRRQTRPPPSILKDALQLSSTRLETVFRNFFKTSRGCFIRLGYSLVCSIRLERFFVGLLKFEECFE